MAESKYLRFIVRLGSLLLAAAAALIIIVYALPWLSPFILAIITARLIEPVVLFMKKKFGFQRTFTSAVCTIIFILLLIALLTLLLSGLISKIIDVAETLPHYLSSLPNTANLFQTKLQSLISSASPEMRGFIEIAINDVISRLNSLPSFLSGKLLSFFTSCASSTPKVLFFFLTYTIGTFFISSTYQTVILFIVKQFPDRLQGKVKQMRSDMFGTLGIWVRSELILMGVTFSLLLISFFLLGVKSAFTAALIIAAIDSLPILGTGIFLIPWSLLLFIDGNYGTGAAIIVIWGITCLVRSFLEPKILGNRVGLHPAAALLAIYVGFCLLGIIGMVLFPLTLIIFKQFHDKGYVKLWK